MFFEEMIRLQNDLERAFQHLDPSWAFQPKKYPSINLFETNDHQIIVTTELPGFDKKDLKLELKNDVLIIEGERKIQMEKGANYHRRERSSGKFFREIKLPFMVNKDMIQAHLTDGVLTIALTKSPEVQPKLIPIH